MKPLKTGQQGVIALIWLYGLGALAIIAALTGLVIAWNSYTSGLDKKGYDRGVSETTARFQARDNAQLQAVLVAQRQAQDRAAKAEADAAKAQSLASANYQKGVRDGKNATDSRIADIRSGKLGLRDPGNQGGTGTACNSQTGAATVAAGATGSDAGTGGELPATSGGLLSAEASGFLLGLTGEADDTARQLSAAQAVILSDRALCNAP